MYMPCSSAILPGVVTVHLHLAWDSCFSVQQAFHRAWELGASGTCV